MSIYRMAVSTSCTYYLITLILFGVCCHCQEDDSLLYKLVEEVRTGTEIGNVLRDSDLPSLYPLDVVNTMQFSFLSEPRVRFTIGESDGILRTNDRIDRDIICPNKDICRIHLDIAVRPVQYFQIIKVAVDIIDLNDNWPKFPDPQITHPILESTTVGSSFVIPSAIDEDSPKYGIQRYELAQSSSSKFELKIATKLDGSKDVRLVLRSKLDREMEQQYKVQVLAHDGGTQPGILDITVNVLDSNDNDPVFQNNTYEVFIPENVPVRETVVVVQASDMDVGLNGLVIYSFSAGTAAQYGFLFGLNNQTGEIFVKGRLDHEEATIYNLIVTAADQGPDSLPAEATVVVHILDLNDNPPQITVNTLAASATNRAEISEDSPTGTFVAHVTVTDPDSGDNGRFNCSLNDNSFRLVQRYESEYQIITAATLDRERVPQYNLALVCRDLGADSQVAIKHIQVIVVDTNDHSPIFHRQKYVATMIENNFIGARVLSVNASDRDLGRNADIQYTLSEFSQWFHIDPYSGIITAKVSIDRESNDQFTFHVIATDNGNPPRTSSAIVIVSIEDVNDESPQFTQPDGYTFSVEENKLPGQEVGTILAEDHDGPEFNHLNYNLAIGGSSSDLFFIHPRTGVITTREKLDREKQLVYYMNVVAKDEGNPPMSNSVSVTVYVTDVNDNKPSFSYPSDYNNTIYISNKVPVGHIVTRAQAKDLDVDHNAELTYIFYSGNEANIFGIDHEIGTISVNERLSEISYHLYELHIMAKDHGIPERYDVATLNIIVNKSIPFPLGGTTNNSILSGHNFVIVMSLGCVCAMVTIILVVTIILIRRQDHGKRIRKYNCRMEALRMLTAKEALSPSEESTPCKEPSKSGGNIDINTGVIRNGSNSSCRPMKMEVKATLRQTKDYPRHSSAHLVQDYLKIQESQAQCPSQGRPWVIPPKDMEVHNLLHMWPGRPDDAESVHSGDDSNTDSGRGVSDEGETIHKLDAHQAGMQGRSPRPDPQGLLPGPLSRGRDPSHPGYYVAPQRPPSSHSYSSIPPRLQSFGGAEKCDTVGHLSHTKIFPGPTYRPPSNSVQQGSLTMPIHGCTKTETSAKSTHTSGYRSRTSQLESIKSAKLPPPYKSAVV